MELAVKGLLILKTGNDETGSFKAGGRVDKDIKFVDHLFCVNSKNMEQAKQYESEKYLEKYRELSDMHQYLKEHKAVGFLIGGKLFAIARGASPQELSSRKDTDILITTQGNLDFQSGKYEGYDLFLVNPSLGTVENSQGFTPPFYIHYLGEQALEPGLYLLPTEAVQLMLMEQKLRRSAEKSISLEHKLAYKKELIPDNVDEVNREDIVIEFPGDISWLRESASEMAVPINIHSAESGTNFVSFTKIEQIPNSVFADTRPIRRPLFKSLDPNLFPEPQSEDIVVVAQQLLKKGDVLRAIEIIYNVNPQSLDTREILEEIASSAEEQPRLCAEGFSMWVKTAIENDFNTLNDDKEEEFTLLKNTAEKIAQKLISLYGNTYSHQAASLINFKKNIQERIDKSVLQQEIEKKEYILDSRIFLNPNKEDLKDVGHFLLAENYIIDGITYLKETGLYALDSRTILDKVTEQDVITEYPAQCAMALSQLLRTAIDNKFTILLRYYYNEGEIDKLQNIFDQIAEQLVKFSSEFALIAPRLKGFKDAFEKQLPPIDEILMDCKDKLDFLFEGWHISIQKENENIITCDLNDIQSLHFINQLTKEPDIKRKMKEKFLSMSNRNRFEIFIPLKSQSNLQKFCKMLDITAKDMVDDIKGILTFISIRGFDQATDILRAFADQKLWRESFLRAMKDSFCFSKVQFLIEHHLTYLHQDDVQKFFELIGVDYQKEICEKESNQPRKR